MFIGVGIVEVLRDGRIRAGIDLALEIQQVLARTFRLRMPFGIGRHLDAKAVTGFGADERHQFVGIAKLAGVIHARWQIAAQRDDAFDATLAEGGQHVAHALLRRADAGQVRGGGVAGGGDFHHRGQRAIARRTAGAVGDGKEFGLQHGKPGHRGAQLLHALGGLRREKLDG